jgi:predicted membrane channel-forming protein YqfA (hemolysin III family)
MTLSGVVDAQPNYTFGEEFCNVIAHVSVLAFASYHLLTYKPDIEPIDEESEKKTISPTGKHLLLFSLTMAYANSTLYHTFVPRIFNTIFRFVDHFSVVITMIGTIAPVISVLFSVIVAFVYFRLFLGGVRIMEGAPLFSIHSPLLGSHDPAVQHSGCTSTVSIHERIIHLCIQDTFLHSG